MANLLYKIVRNKSTGRMFANFKTPSNIPKPTPTRTCINTYNPILFLDPKSSDNEKDTQKFRVFPSFPFGYCLNPISSTGFDELNAIEAKEVESDDARTVWADSVKKKRKKKMNKHKYKKLRKRLRRKT